MAALQFFLALLPLALLLQISTSTVHEVLPDSKSLNGDHKLKYYQDNGRLYFTSNTQLHFIPGIFLIKSLLTISNVTNFSLVGSTSDDTVLTCSDDTAGVLIVCSDGIIIKNIAITNCSYIYRTRYKWKSSKIPHDPIKANLMIIRCKNIAIEKSLFFSLVSIGLSLYNPKGNSSLHNIQLNSILITVNYVKNQTYLLLSRLSYMPSRLNNDYVISIIISDHSSNIVVILSQIVFNRFLALHVHIETCIGKNYIGINNVSVENFNDNSRPEYGDLDVVMIYFVSQCTKFMLYRVSSTQIQFMNSHFIHIYGDGLDASVISITMEEQQSIFYCFINFINVTFSDIQKTRIVTSKKITSLNYDGLNKIWIGVVNSVFNRISFTEHLISVVDVYLSLDGSVYFTNISNITKAMITSSGVHITMNHYTEFSFISSFILIAAEYIVIQKYAVVNFTSNNFKMGIFQHSIAENGIVCMFQYNKINSKQEINAMRILHKKEKDYLITFKNNSGNKLFNNNKL